MENSNSQHELMDKLNAVGEAINTMERLRTNLNDKNQRLEEENKLLKNFLGELEVYFFKTVSNDPVPKRINNIKGVLHQVIESSEKMILNLERENEILVRFLEGLEALRIDATPRGKTVEERTQFILNNLPII